MGSTLGLPLFVFFLRSVFFFPSLVIPPFFPLAHLLFLITEYFPFLGSAPFLPHHEGRSRDHRLLNLKSPHKKTLSSYDFFFAGSQSQVHFSLRLEDRKGTLAVAENLSLSPFTNNPHLWVFLIYSPEPVFL